MVSVSSGISSSPSTFPPYRFTRPARSQWTGIRSGAADHVSAASTNIAAITARWGSSVRKLVRIASPPFPGRGVLRNRAQKLHNRPVHLLVHRDDQAVDDHGSATLADEQPRP